MPHACSFTIDVNEVPDPAGDCHEQMLTMWDEEEAAQVEDIRAARLLGRVRRLAPLQRQVIRWGFGLDGEDRLTARQIANRLGVSPSTVAAHRAAALGHLRTDCENDGLQAVLQAA